MSARRGEAQLEIRKLRKKLRQIEHLETVDRELDDAEIDKLVKKGSIRSRLLELLTQYSDVSDPSEHRPVGACDSDSGHHGDDDTDTDALMNTSEESQAQTTSDPQNEAFDLGQEEDIETPQENPVLPLHGKDTDKTERFVATTSQYSAVQTGKAKEPRGSEAAADKPARAHVEKAPCPSPAKKQKKVDQGSGAILQKTKEQSKKSNSKVQKFRVLTLDGHNDLICSVALHGDHLLTGSRDTTVKLWSAVSGLELCSMGGHSGTVTAVLLVSGRAVAQLKQYLEVDEEAPELLAISGSSDCSVRIWDVETGHCIKSLYTFNPITCLAVLVVGQASHLLIGSGGGKLEMWDLASEVAVQSIKAQDDAISSLWVEGSFVYTSSVLGIVQVYQLRDQTLHLLFESDDAKLATGGYVIQRPIRSLAASEQRVYYGDDGMNLKVLDWKQAGEVHKLSHHSMEFGVTDAVCCSENSLLFASGYDLDNGVGYVNVWGLPSESYQYTLCDEDTSRILCLDCYQDVEKRKKTIVTGGTELKLWRQCTQDEVLSESDTVVSSQKIPQFLRQARNSDIESDTDTSENESEMQPPDDPPLPWRHSEEPEERKGWLSWCNIL